MPQIWNAEEYREKVPFVSELGATVLDLLAPQAHESILDLGCGDGALSQKICQKICTGELIAIDSSKSMVRAARARGLNAIQMSGDAIDYESKFDAVFSNAALHWIQDYRAVLQGVAKSLQPGGRFVGEFGGKGNLASIIAAIEKVSTQHSGSFENPWFFPSAEEYKLYLEESGFAVPYIELIPRATLCNLADWLKTFAVQMISEVPDFIARVKEVLGADDDWEIDYVRLRFYATKK